MNALNPTFRNPVTEISTLLKRELADPIAQAVEKALNKYFQGVDPTKVEAQRKNSAKFATAAKTPTAKKPAVQPKSTEPNFSVNKSKAGSQFTDLPAPQVNKNQTIISKNIHDENHPFNVEVDGERHILHISQEDSKKINLAIDNIKLELIAARQGKTKKPFPAEFKGTVIQYITNQIQNYGGVNSTNVSHRNFVNVITGPLVKRATHGNSVDNTQKVTQELNKVFQIVKKAEKLRATAPQETASLISEKSLQRIDLMITKPQNYSLEDVQYELTKALFEIFCNNNNKDTIKSAGSMSKTSMEYKAAKSKGHECDFLYAQAGVLNSKLSRYLPVVKQQFPTAKKDAVAKIVLAALTDKSKIFFQIGNMFDIQKNHGLTHKKLADLTKVLIAKTEAEAKNINK